MAEEHEHPEMPEKYPMQVVYMVLRRRQGIFKRFYKNTGWMGIARVIIVVVGIALLVQIFAKPSAGAAVLFSTVILIGGVAGFFTGWLLAKGGQFGAVLLNALTSAMVIASILIPMASRSVQAMGWLGLVGFVAFLLTAYFRFMGDPDIVVMRPAKLPWYKINRAGYVDREL